MPTSSISSCLLFSLPQSFLVKALRTPDTQIVQTKNSILLFFWMSPIREKVLAFRRISVCGFHRSAKETKSLQERSLCNALLKCQNHPGFEI